MGLNIVNVANIEAKRASVAVTTTGNTLISAVATDHVAKINTLVVANIDGTDPCDITVTAGGSLIASTVTVPADSSLYVITKDTSIYLQPTETLVVTSSADGDLVATVSYEELS